MQVPQTQVPLEKGSDCSKGPERWRTTMEKVMAMMMMEKTVAATITRASIGATSSMGKKLC